MGSHHVNQKNDEKFLECFINHQAKRIHQKVVRNEQQKNYYSAHSPERNEYKKRRYSKCKEIIKWISEKKVWRVERITWWLPEKTILSIQTISEWLSKTTLCGKQRKTLTVPTRQQEEKTKQVDAFGKSKPFYGGSISRSWLCVRCGRAFFKKPNQNTLVAVENTNTPTSMSFVF